MRGLVSTDSMSEKALLNDGPGPGRWRYRSGSTRTIVTCIAAAVIYVVVSWRSFCLPIPCLSDHQKLHYEGESIDWEPCGEINDHQVECSSLQVPMDHFDKENSGNQTFSLPLIRLRAHNATRSLFVNPGGPGGSGVQFIRRRGDDLNAIIGEGYHILSFDPRGVAGSRPQAQCYPDDETKQRLNPINDKYIVADSPDIWAWSSNFAQSCVETMGEHGKYINTPQTAADMNSILDALGQETLTYWGFSYGTLLGQTYASLFPERSERVIIDGVVNLFEWYSSPFFDESLMDTENVLQGFLDECVKAGASCALSKLADSTAELKQKIYDFSDKLKLEPISVYVNNTLHGVFGRRELWFGAIFQAMYAPAQWPLLADRLAALMQGNATEAFIAYGQEAPFVFGDFSNEFVVLNDGVSGPEQWPVDRLDLLAEIVAYINTSSFAAAENKGLYERRAWQVPQTHSFVPTTGVETAHPLLILSTTYDPVCPLASARAANNAFKGSRLLELEGYGHCTIAMPSLCVAKHVRNFLYHGKMPDDGVRCERDGVYYPDATAGTLELAEEQYSEEERGIHDAQVAMAQDMDWPRPGFRS